MNRRILGVIVLVSFLVIAISGIYMLLMPYQKNVATAHTLFTLLFTTLIILHIINNRRSLYQYFIPNRRKKKGAFFAYLLAILIVCVLILSLKSNRLTNAFYETAYEYRMKKAGKASTGETFDQFIIERAIKNYQIHIDAKKGVHVGYPLFAIWLEDSAGNYIETVYISKSIASSNYQHGTKENGRTVPAILRRPEALPVWAHKRNIQEDDGLYMPLHLNSDLDGVSGATPKRSFQMITDVNLNNHNMFKLRLEVNQSFDWNQYYRKDSYPDDVIYSGSGKVGQPALVYECIINLEKAGQQPHLMQLVGHSHHSGQTGDLYTSLDHITTAKDILDWIVVRIKPTN